MRFRNYLDLASVLLLSILLIPAVTVPFPDWIRVGLGVPYVFFVPGYTIICVLFPRLGQLGTAEKIAFSLALSFASVALIGLALNYVWEINLIPMLVCTEVLVVASGTAAAVRRHELGEMIPGNPMESVFARLKKMPGIDIFLYTMLGVAILVATGIAVQTYLKNITPISEIYLLGENGKAADYPSVLAVGEQARVRLVVTNHERADTEYRLDSKAEAGLVWIDGESDSLVFTLQDRHSREFIIGFEFNSAGPGQKIDFNLYKADSAEVYLKVYLKIDVVP